MSTQSRARGSMVSSEIPPAPAYLIELRRKRPLLFSIDEFTAGIYCSQKTTSTLSDANKTSNNSLKFQSKTELQRLKEFTDAAGEVSTFRCKTDNRPVKSKLTPTIMFTTSALVRMVRSSARRPSAVPGGMLLSLRLPVFAWTSTKDNRLQRRSWRSTPVL